MATTVPGGRYLSADQKFWLDSEGKVIGENKPEAQAEAPAEVAAAEQPKPEDVSETEPAKKAKK